jgi:hypothetical protein
VGTTCQRWFERASFASSFDWFCDCTLHETLITQQNWSHVVDMNHRLNLGGIEVIRSMDGMKKGAMGLVWSSSTVKDVHRAVERQMKKKISFRVIGERHDDMLIEDVELDVKELLIYLVKHCGLDKNV